MSDRVQCSKRVGIGPERYLGNNRFQLTNENEVQTWSLWSCSQMDVIISFFEIIVCYIACCEEARRTPEKYKAHYLSIIQYSMIIQHALEQADSIVLEVLEAGKAGWINNVNKMVPISYETRTMPD